MLSFCLPVRQTCGANCTAGSTQSARGTTELPAKLTGLHVNHSFKKLLLFNEHATVDTLIKTSLQHAGAFFFCNFPILVCRMSKYRTALVYLHLSNLCYLARNTEDICWILLITPSSEKETPCSVTLEKGDKNDSELKHQYLKSRVIYYRKKPQQNKLSKVMQRMKIRNHWFLIKIN